MSGFPKRLGVKPLFALDEECYRRYCQILKCFLIIKQRGRTKAHHILGTHTITKHFGKCVRTRRIFVILLCGVPKRNNYNQVEQGAHSLVEALTTTPTPPPPTGPRAQTAQKGQSRGFHIVVCSVMT